MAEAAAPLLDPPRLVMVVADGTETWASVRTQLEASGWQVELVDLEALVGAGTPENVLPPMEAIRAGLVVVGSATTTSTTTSTITSRGGPGWGESHLGVMIAYLQGRLGPEQVVGLVERSQMGLVAPTGMAAVTYPPGGPGATEFAAVLTYLSPAATREPPVGSWVVRHLRQVRPEMWLLLGPLAVIGAVLVVFGLGWLNWRPVPDGLRRISVDLASLQPVLPSALTPESDAVDAGAVDPLGDLPVTCTILTANAGETLPGTIACDGVGELVVEGHPGPWHNEISSVALDSGAVGTVTMEARSGQGVATTVALAAGAETSLESADPAFGVDRIDVTFGADRQRVILRQAPARGGRTVTFTLHLGS